MILGCCIRPLQRIMSPQKHLKLICSPNLFGILCAWSATNCWGHQMCWDFVVQKYLFCSLSRFLQHPIFFFFLNFFGLLSPHLNPVHRGIVFTNPTFAYTPKMFFFPTFKNSKYLPLFSKKHQQEGHLRHMVKSWCKCYPTWVLVGVFLLVSAPPPFQISMSPEATWSSEAPSHPSSACQVGSMINNLMDDRQILDFSSH